MNLAIFHAKFHMARVAGDARIYKNAKGANIRVLLFIRRSPFVSMRLLGRCEWRLLKGFFLWSEL